MRDYTKLRARFLRDPVDRRLGALAADLARIGSMAGSPGDAHAVAVQLEEARRFVEWTAAETDIDVAAELVDIQLALTLWLGGWPDAVGNPSLRAALAQCALAWSDRVLALSGLVEPEPEPDRVR